MKKLVISTVAILALGTTFANAGGKLVEIPKVPPIVVDSWSGPYIGVQLGYNKGKADSQLDINSKSVLSEMVIQRRATYKGNAKPGGFIGGVFIGYNRLLDNNWLMGIELAGNYLNIKKDANLVDSSGNSVKVNIKQKGEVALYAKFGKVLGNNNSTLLYGVGGVVGTKLQAKYANITKKKTIYGWTVGSGLEHKINENWHIRVQYRFSRYEDAKYDFINNSVKGKVKAYKTHSIMAGISYHF